MPKMNTEADVMRLLGFILIKRYTGCTESAACFFIAQDCRVKFKESVL